MITDLLDARVDLTYMNDILPTSTGAEFYLNPITINLRIIAAYSIHVGRDDTSQVH
jgi:hypothetical protein